MAPPIGPVPLTPDQAKGWFNTLYSFTERSTPITMVFILITGGLFSWYMLNELSESRRRVIQVHTSYIASKDAHLANAVEYANSLAKIALHCNVPVQEVMPKVYHPSQ